MAVAIKKKPVDLRGLAPLIRVFDMSASLHFYCDILGFEIIGSAGDAPRYGGWVLLRHDKTELMMEPIYPEDKQPSVPDPVRTENHEDTAIYFGCPDPDAVYHHLLANGITVKEPRVAYYGMKQLYVKDPDGFILCFQWPATKETADQWQKRYGFDPGSIKATS